MSIRINNGHTCAGTIINEWWILTVSTKQPKIPVKKFKNLPQQPLQGANCLSNEPVAGISILHSSTYLRTTGINIIQAEKYISHEGFNASNTFIHDIAVVKLKSPMQIDLFDYKVKFAIKGALYTTGMLAVFAGLALN